MYIHKHIETVLLKNVTYDAMLLEQTHINGLT